MSDQNSKKPAGPNNPMKGGFSFYWIYAVIAIVLIGLMVFNGSSDGSETNYAQVKSWAESNYIARVEYNGSTGKVYLDSLGKANLKGQYPEQKVLWELVRAVTFGSTFHQVSILLTSYML